jgi:hypothetical protein
VVTHNGAETSDGINETGLLPADVASAIRSLSNGAATEPSPEALQAQVAELQRELRNTDFRLQFLYRTRTSTADLLAEAIKQVEQQSK